MADDIDVEALLDAPFKADGVSVGAESRSHSERTGRRSRTPERSRHWEQSRRNVRGRRTRSPSPGVGDADRDQRTVFVMQLAARLKNSELAEFFAKAGRVRDARIVVDKNSGRSKGVAYVEFYSMESVPSAIALTGQKLLGIPVIVQPTEAEKNRLAAQAALAATMADDIAFRRVRISALPPQLSDDDVQKMFVPFGFIDSVQLQRPAIGAEAQGAVAYIVYARASDARNALLSMNGFMVLNKPIKVELASDNVLPSARLDDNLENEGFSLTSQSRHALMQKLANRSTGPDPSTLSATQHSLPTTITSRAMLLRNMFDPATETEENWASELEEEVFSECEKFGNIVHLKLEKDSEGEVYVKFGTPQGAESAIRALDKRWFAARQISATLVPEAFYHAKYPRAAQL
ncbi:hypothetical protein THASP1DRAFT_29546 [Thamnocephalis sphaerospora]|uniref:RRM domain-containing protein n=1 Tax=Thamnocephalis sphaerospora TaxID=78915 RepID=A0A4P9XRF9_9FUNG|nr:hypothetical protein THASP1DRAFT_29546 [Thamnocephalis sphaerospora]|eukprot:RKP08648.1 hypothetical protein THASP1DRAFT_29546 [Thamnocephalis sphaerospora]